VLATVSVFGKVLHPAIDIATAIDAIKPLSFTVITLQFHLERPNPSVRASCFWDFKMSLCFDISKTFLSDRQISSPAWLV